jgi:hypothetical protein
MATMNTIEYKELRKELKKELKKKLKKELKRELKRKLKSTSDKDVLRIKKKYQENESLRQSNIALIEKLGSNKGSYTSTQVYWIRPGLNMPMLCDVINAATLTVYVLETGDTEQALPHELRSFDYMKTKA